MSTRCTIGRLAEGVGLPVSTLRFYERTGLLKPDGRTRGNYRYYGQGAVERLRFIRAAQSIGFTIEGIHQLLSVRDGGDPVRCGAVREMIETRLAAVTDQIDQLEAVRHELEAALARCRATPAADPCDIVANLELAASGRRAGQESSCDSKRS